MKKSVFMKEYFVKEKVLKNVIERKKEFLINKLFIIKHFQQTFQPLQVSIRNFK